LAIMLCLSIHCCAPNSSTDINIVFMFVSQRIRLRSFRLRSDHFSVHPILVHFILTEDQVLAVCHCRLCYGQPSVIVYCSNYQTKV
jgi:hypothetical protein